MAKIVWIAVAAWMLPAPALSSSGDSENLDQLDARARELASDLGKSAMPVDRRIRLARCPAAPVISVADIGGLAVRCEALGWRLRIALVDDQLRMAVRSSSGPVIRRGDPVRLRIEHPAFVLSYSAIALENGRTGDSIALRTGDKGVVRAQVTGEGEAVLRE